jgi:hypothetical protein
MQFDNNGHLMPYEIQEITLDEFRYFFVEKLGDSGHRTQLFNNYLRFIEDLKASFVVPFYQWVDGSFITTKEFPGDIDVVTFMSYETITNKAAEVHHYRENAKTEYLVDAAFCPICRWNHRYFEKYKKNEEYWNNWYRFSRPNNEFNRFPKGIIKISFEL